MQFRKTWFHVWAALLNSGPDESRMTCSRVAFSNSDPLIRLLSFDVGSMVLAVVVFQCFLRHRGFKRVHCIWQGRKFVFHQILFVTSPLQRIFSKRCARQNEMGPHRPHFVHGLGA